jgi:hypothetical protein
MVRGRSEEPGRRVTNKTPSSVEDRGWVTCQADGRLSLLIASGCVDRVGALIMSLVKSTISLCITHISCQQRPHKFGPEYTTLPHLSSKRNPQQSPFPQSIHHPPECSTPPCRPSARPTPRTNHDKQQQHLSRQPAHAPRFQD